MFIPTWLIVTVAIVVVALLAWAVVSAFAWWGLSLQLEEALGRTKLLQVDVFAARDPLRPVAGRWRTDRARIETEHSS